MDSPDLQTKYQKLAAEYAKLRAQIPVLKKGVLDEQAKYETLKNEVKDKDKSVRKYEQEVDSLTFRNDQLTKRVQILQAELENAKPGKSKKEAPAPTTNATNVFDEELQNKIEENARLHKQIHDIDQRHNQAMIEVQNNLEKFQRDANDHKQDMESLTTAFKAQVEALLEEKAMLEVKLLSLETHSRDLKTRADSAEFQLSSISQELSVGLPGSVSIDDLRTSVSVQSFAGTPDDDSHRDKIRAILTEGRGLVRELTHALTNFHSYSEQRLMNFVFDPIPEKVQNLSKLLCDNGTHLKPLDAALKHFSDSLDNDITSAVGKGLLDFSAKFTLYVKFYSEVHQAQLACLEIENTAKCASTDLRLKNRELHFALVTFLNSLKQIDHCLNAVAEQFRSVKSNQPNIEKQYRELVVAVHAWHDSVRDVSRHYNTKVSLEMNAFDANQKFKTANECVVSSLISLVAITGKVVNFLKSQVDFVSKPDLSAHDQTDKTSETSSMDGSTTSISQQLSNFRDKMQTVEQEREHWMLEAQLLKAKYEKEATRNRELEKKLSSISDDLESNLASVEIAESPDKESHDSSDDEISMREKLVKDYYMSRISDLQSQLYIADSKAVNFYQECHNLHKRLFANERNKSRLQSELDLANLDLSQLKDELHTTTKSYEDQLSLMSEHIAELNDKLARLDELESLRPPQQSAASRLLRGKFDKS